MYVLQTLFKITFFSIKPSIYRGFKVFSRNSDFGTLVANIETNKDYKGIERTLGKDLIGKQSERARGRYTEQGVYEQGVG